MLLAVVYYGMCVPSVCDLSSYSSLPVLLADTINAQHLDRIPPIPPTNIIIYESINENARVAQWTPLAIFALITLLLLVLCLVLGTSLAISDLIQAKKKQQKRDQLLEASS